MPRRTTDGESAMATCRGPRRSPVEIGRSATIPCSDSATAGARFELGTRPRPRAALTIQRIVLRLVAFVDVSSLTSGGQCPGSRSLSEGAWFTASPRADFAHTGGRPNDTEADLVIRREPFPGPAARGLAARSPETRRSERGRGAV